MKRCPTCNRVETDDALAFCRVDGATLVTGPLSDSETTTAHLGTTPPASEVETDILPHHTNEALARGTGPTTALPSQRLPSQTRPLAKRRRTRYLIAAGVAIVIVAAVCSYFLFGMQREAITSVAVLPFEDRSGNTESEYISDGLAESLIYRLSQLPNLKVSPTSSVMRYKGKEVDVQKIAADLGVDAVMSGHVVQRGDNLTISVELIDARNNHLLWGEQFERKMSELMTTQREIATAISQKLQLKLSGEEPGLTKRYTSDNEAYQRYLKGRYYWNKRTAESLQRAIEQFSVATEKDPRFALAYSGLADCYAILATYLGRDWKQMQPLARANALKAIELDSSLAEPHATLGMLYHFEWRPAEAEAELKRALELNANYATAHHWYSRFLRSAGRNDEAWTQIKLANEIDPLSLVILNNIAENQYDRGELDEATSVCQKIIDLEPTFWAGHHTLAIILLKQDRKDDALIEAQKSVDLSKRANGSLALLAHVYGRLGKRADAEKIIKELQERYESHDADGRDLAVAYAGLNDKEQVFAWLEKAFQERSHFLGVLRLEMVFDSVKSDPRWDALLKRVGI
jgi:TolB-like protein/Tfp pilus assembly protein PilF